MPLRVTNLFCAFCAFLQRKSPQLVRSITAMKTIILSICAFAFLLLNAVAQQPDYPQLKNDAEAQSAQGAYPRANKLYSRIDKSKLNPTEARWVEFRLADTSWRAEAATQTSDTTRLEQAQKQLEEFIRLADKDTERDLVWQKVTNPLVVFSGPRATPTGPTPCRPSQRHSTGGPD